MVELLANVQRTRRHLGLHLELVERIGPLGAMVVSRLVVALEVRREIALRHRIAIDANLANLHSLGRRIATVLVQLHSKLGSLLLRRVSLTAQVLIPILLLVHVVAIDARPGSRLPIVVLLLSQIVCVEIATFERCAAIELPSPIELSLILTPHSN